MRRGGDDEVELPELSPEAIEELATLYRTTHNMRLHIRAQMVLLAAEQHMVAADIAKIVRTDEQTVRRWLSATERRASLA